MAVGLIVSLLMVLGAGSIALNGRRPWERVHRSGVRGLELLRPPVPGPLPNGLRVVETREPDTVVLAYRSSSCDRAPGSIDVDYTPDDILIRVDPDTRGCRDVFGDGEPISAIAVRLESDIAGRSVRVDCVGSRRCNRAGLR